MIKLLAIREMGASAESRAIRTGVSMMRAYPVAGIAGLTGKSEVITFTFCDACNTIVFGRDVSHCTKCGSTTLERLGLIEIASRLRAQCTENRSSLFRSRGMHG